MATVSIDGGSPIPIKDLVIIEKLNRMSNTPSLTDGVSLAMECQPTVVDGIQRLLAIQEYKKTLKGQMQTLEEERFQEAAFKILQKRKKK